MASSQLIVRYFQLRLIMTVRSETILPYSHILHMDRYTSLIGRLLPLDTHYRSFTAFVGEGFDLIQV